MTNGKWKMSADLNFPNTSGYINILVNIGHSNIRKKQINKKDLNLNKTILIL